MSVWFCIPSKRPAHERDEVLKLWKKQGYKIALFLDDDSEVSKLCADYVYLGLYRGYANSVNTLAFEIMEHDPEVEWIVTGGDDTQPDLAHTAEQIAVSCSNYFYTLAQDVGRPKNCGSRSFYSYWATYGVMQPTGDRWGDRTGPYVERVAGSPWLGREWCRRANQGHGPLWPEYFHMGVDEELQAVATMQGVFWQRPDLIHLHKHWGRHDPGKAADPRNMPSFLHRANSREEWDKFKAIFARRKQQGFPGSEPL